MQFPILSSDVGPVAPGSVLVATHGLESADGAVRLGSAFAGARHVMIEALAVAEAFWPDHVDRLESLANLDEYRSQWLTDHVRRQFGRVAVQDMPIVVAWGDVATRVAQRAATLHAGLIVVGLEHQGPVDRFLGGEIAIAVLHRTTVPVLAAAPQATAPFASIVIATDFSAAAARAARLSVSCAARDAAVHVVHVSPWEDPVWEHIYRRGAEELCKELGASLELPSTARVTVHIKAGEPARVVRDLAVAQHADLLALGSRGRKLIHRIALGSVAESVLRWAECSVLVSPPLE